MPKKGCTLNDCKASNNGSHDVRSADAGVNLQYLPFFQVILHLGLGKESCSVLLHKPLSTPRHIKQESVEARKLTRGHINKDSVATRWTSRMASSFCGPTVSSVLIPATTCIKQATRGASQYKRSPRWTEMSDKCFMDYVPFLWPAWIPGLCACGSLGFCETFASIVPRF